jgi:cytochrome b561
MSLWRNSPTNYGAISLVFHWLMALLVLIMLGLGWGRYYVPRTWTPWMMDLHKSLGIIILVLVFARVLWRMYEQIPPLPREFTKSEKLIAHVAHYSLYLFMLAMPLSGWLMMSAMGRNPSFFGFIDLPALIEKSPAWVPFLKNVHGLMAYGFAGLITVHVLAAFFHHFIRKDDILRRMLPLIKKKINES